MIEIDNLCHYVNSGFHIVEVIIPHCGQHYKFSGEIFSVYFRYKKTFRKDQPSERFLLPN